MYIQVNIGRNVADSPMAEGKWLLFISWTIDAIKAATGGDSYVETHRGVGSYNGTLEESAHLSTFATGDVDLGLLRQALEALKVIFDQDAIALIVGSELV